LSSADPGNPACTLGATSQDFGSIPQGSAELPLVVTNSGGGILEGAVSASCPDFVFLERDLHYLLAVAESKTFTLRFTPTHPGEQQCVIAAGTSCAPITFTGRMPPPACAFTADNRDFGSIQGHADLPLVVTNTGGGILQGAVSEDCPDFAFLDPSLGYALAGGESRTFTLRFAPAQVGEQQCVVSTGSSCAPMTFSGRMPPCTLSENRDFGGVPEGGSADLPLVVTNSGGGILEGEMSESCPDFAFLEGDLRYTLAHGESKAFTLRFTPTRPGEQQCLVSTGSSCAPIAFTARRLPVTPIATIHADPAAYRGRRTTVEAQVFIAANYGGTSPQGWVQDRSGRGMQVIGSGAANPLLFDIRNTLRITGAIGQDGTSLRMQDIGFVTLLSSGNLPLSPAVLSTGEAARPAWDDTYVQVTGAVVEKTEIPGEFRYVLDDGTGRIAVLVKNALHAPGFALQEVVTARGAGGLVGGEYIIQVGRAADLESRGSSRCIGRRVIVGDAVGTAGQRVQVPIQLQWNPRPIDAFGMRLAYDGTALRFVEGHCCGLTEGWHTCEARSAARDTLILGGFNPTPIPAGSNGELLCLTFEFVQCAAARQLVLLGLVDDLAGMEICDGSIGCFDCLSDGDVNQDGLLTPGDAQCAFEIFLHGQAVPPDCDVAGTCEGFAADVNCSGGVTPGDALAIFSRWLGGNSTPQHCLAGGSTAPVAGAVLAPGVERNDLYRLDVQRARRSGSGLVSVPLEMRAAPGRAAFGVQIDFDPAAVEFVALRPTAESARWRGLGARRAAPGRLLVGGFDPRVDPTSLTGRDLSRGWLTVAEIDFRDVAGHFDLGQVDWIEQILGSGAPAPGGTLAGLLLGKPFPNPVRSGVVSLDLVIPPGGGAWVEVGIHDVTGRLVRTLHVGSLAEGTHQILWDRTNERSQPVAAGIYFVQMRSGQSLEKRKLVVLE
jgi:hypothetical protein